MISIMRTHYNNLQVQENADQAIIKASYKVLAQRYHPDRNRDDAEEANRVFLIITDAYETLSDPDRRSVYDAKLRAARRAGVPPETRAAVQKSPAHAPHMSQRAVPISTNPSGLLNLAANTQMGKRLQRLMKRVADNQSTPPPVRWLLNRPVHLVVMVQVIVATYLFRDVIF